jgi:cytochrome c oxidase subunit 1
MGLFIMFYNLIHSLFTGEKSGDNPWGGATLEWRTSSPPPTENFEEAPVVTKGPYSFR